MVDQGADRLPVGRAGVRLRHGAAVQGDRGTAGLLRDPAGVEIGEVGVVESLAGLHRHRDVVRRRGGHGLLEDLAEQVALPGQRPAAALAGHLGHRAAEVEVDVGDAVLTAQDLGGLADVDRVGAVELHRPDGLELVEDQHLQRRVVALDQAARRDHLAHVEAGALLGAQPPVGRVGDAGHRREHHRRRHVQGTQAQAGVGSGGGHASIVGAGGPAGQNAVLTDAGGRPMTSGVPGGARPSRSR